MRHQVLLKEVVTVTVVTATTPDPFAEVLAMEILVVAFIVLLIWGRRLL